MFKKLLIVAIVILMVQVSCNLPGGTSTPEILVTALPTEVASSVPATDTPAVVHKIFPANASNSNLFYDVESASTALEKRAPYGDAYDINRLERPFLQDMTYISDLDIDAFSLTQDAEWFYISIRLIGTDPNNTLGINYGVEFD